MKQSIVNKIVRKSRFVVKATWHNQVIESAKSGKKSDELL